jgi:hypothetical protein
MLVVVALAGCGGSSEPQEVRSVVEAFGKASAGKDYQRICDELISRELSDNVEEIGLPCELAFKRGLGEVRGARLEVKTVAVSQGKALVGVRSSARGQRPSDDVIELRKLDGEWRITALAKPRRQAPARRR